MTQHRLLMPLTVARIALAAAALAVSAGTFAQDDGKLRPLRVEDLFEMEGLATYSSGNSAFAPDGKTFAYTRVRPKKTLKNHKWEYLWDNAGSDVWVQNGPGAQPTNITKGESDGSGWWIPRWSPDGKHLAMASTRGDNVRLWVWSRDSGEIKQLTERALDLTGSVFAWSDNGHIVCSLMPGSEMPLAMSAEIKTPQVATAAWPKTQAGKETTVSALSSGVPVDLSKRPQSDLVVVDIATGQSTAIEHGNMQEWMLAPNGQAVAYARQVTSYLPKAKEELRLDSMSGKFTVEASDLKGRKLLSGEQLSADVLTKSLRWSPDGNELVFLGFGNSRDEAPKLFRLNRNSGKASTLELGDLDAAPIIRKQPEIEWTASGDLLVLAAKLVDGKRPAVTARRDWWLVSRNGSRRMISESFKSVPEELFPQTGRKSFYGLSDGEIWRITPGSAAQNLTQDFQPSIRGIAWPMVGDRNMEALSGDIARSHVVFTTRENGQQNYRVLNLGSGTIKPFVKPAQDATLMAFSPENDSTVYSASGHEGTYIWRTTSDGGRKDELMAANQWLRQVDEGKLKRVDYTSLNGEKLIGWIILPVGYQEGKKYPMLTWVYAGSVFNDAAPSSRYSVSSSSSLSLQIPAAKGYAVLLPSMPLAPEGEADDPMLRLPNGVLPAVDKAVEMGIADPQRLFLGGQSFGGFSTYGLVTQTTRFKAAVSLAGLSNLTSLYGTFEARSRYTDYPQENLFVITLSEGGQVRLGGAPWEDTARYLRNSPIFYVNRVETPLMIIQGDMDYVALQQGEEFFMSLYRQGKRAEFLRYWGEGHVLESPANIVDMWQRIFAWFEEFSPKNP